MKFVIDRSKWRCGNDDGHGIGNTKLRNEKGFMCCLGMISKQAGCSNYVISGKYEPRELRSKNNLKKLVSVGLIEFDKDDFEFVNSELSLEAMDINDHANYTDEEREKKLSELFIKYGHELEFIDEYVDFDF